MKCGEEIEDFMSEEERYKPFRYSCYSCYKELYKHDEEKYDRHLQRYKEDKNDESIEKNKKK